MTETTTPQIILNSKSYKPLNKLEGKTCLVIDDEGKKYSLKMINNNGIITHKDVLKVLAEKEYKRLVLPRFIDAGTLADGRPCVLVEFLEGNDYNGRWNEVNVETSGGRAIKQETIEMFLELADDLINLEVEQFVNTGISILSPERILERFEGNTKIVIGNSIATENQINIARELITKFISSIQEKFQISNEDFQFRNFIDLPSGKTGVIDWEGGRLSNFELEHILAYQWILMWNNPIWQKAFLKEADKRFSIDKNKFQAVLLVDSLNQAAAWSGDSYLGRIQINFFINALNNDYIQFIFN